jgi:hypothetical protein
MFGSSALLEFVSFLLPLHRDSRSALNEQICWAHVGRGARDDSGPPAPKAREGFPPSSILSTRALRRTRTRAITPWMAMLDTCFSKFRWYEARSKKSSCIQVLRRCKDSDLWTVLLLLLLPRLPHPHWSHWSHCGRICTGQPSAMLHCTKVLVTVMDIGVLAVLPSYDLAVRETWAPLSRTENGQVFPHDKTAVPPYSGRSSGLSDVPSDLHRRRPIPSPLPVLLSSNYSIVLRSPIYIVHGSKNTSLI